MTRTSEWFARATIRPEPVLGDSTVTARQRKLLRRTDAKLVPVGADLDRPPPARRVDPLVSRSPEGSNIVCQASPIGRNASSVPRARSQIATPWSVPTASSRPSCRIDGAIA